MKTEREEELEDRRREIDKVWEERIDQLNLIRVQHGTSEERQTDLMIELGSLICIAAWNQQLALAEILQVLERIEEKVTKRDG